MSDLTIDQQRLAHAVRALAADPDDHAVRVRVHDCGARLTVHEIREVLNTLPNSVIYAADLRRRGR
ncbi:hypothetical protein [Demequina maris]|uniref:hypothetical protein n=1 Tax=Demequina maris TaxID=1638982 RepID=UPI000781B78B|nr:hypothetical protein [Demequina maris]